MKQLRYHMKDYSDERGSLRSLEFSLFDFPISRIFTMSVQEREYFRGGHAHKVCWQVLVPIDTGIIALLEMKASNVRYPVNSGEYLIVPPLTWLSVEFLESNKNVLVLASHPFEAGDYIRDKSEFIQWNSSE